MPYIMDDLDALFDEGIDQRQPIAPGLHQHQLVASGLHQRIDEMQRHGCCEKIAWCNNGSLLYVSDKAELEMSLLRFHEHQGKWAQEDHRPPMIQEHIQKIFQGRPIAHVSANPHGAEVVVTDVGGRLIVCAPFVDLNKLLTQKPYPGTENEGNRMIGIHWLQPVQPKKPGAGDRVEKVHFYPTATKQGSRWTFGPAEALPVIGPTNPWGKSGFMLVTALGKLQLYYSTPDLNWFHEDVELYKSEEPSPLLTHAAFCSSAVNEAVLAAVDSSGTVRVQRIRIDWTPAPGQQREHPQIKIDNLVCFKMFGPSLENPATAILGGGSLSFMKLLLDRTQNPGEDVLPTLMVAYHVMPAMQQTTFNAASQTAMKTVIAQYEFRSSVPDILPIFNTLSSKRNAKQTLRPQVSVTPLENEVLEGIVLEVCEQQFGRSLGLAYSDGKIEFMDRALKILTLDSSPEKVSTLTQMGFSFPAGDLCLYNAFSAHACVRATMARGEKPKLSAIQVAVSLMEVADAAFSDKATAAFVLEFIGKGTGADFIDVLMALRAFLEQLDIEAAVNWKTSFLRSFASAMHITAKMGEQTTPELMASNSLFQRFLSVQEALGHGSADSSLAGDNSPRTSSSHLAWILQNLRQQMAVIVVLVRQSGPGRPPEYLRPEGTVALGNYASWCCTLAEWTVAQILAANRELDYPKDPSDLKFPPSQINEHIPASARIAGTLLMLRLGRTYFKLCLMGIRNVGKHLESMPAYEMPEQWWPMDAALRDRVFHPPEFSRFLESCEDLCTQMFSQIPVGKDASEKQAEMQRDIIRKTVETEAMIKGQCEGNIAAIFLTRLVTSGAWSLRKSCKEHELVYVDYSALDPLPLDSGKIVRPPDIIWDGSRKVELGRRKIVNSGLGDDDSHPYPTPRTSPTFTTSGAANSAPAKTGTDNVGSKDSASAPAATDAIVASEQMVARMDLDGDMDLSRRLGIRLEPGDELSLSRRWMADGKEVPALRTCTRCANVMEDQPPQRQRTDWLISLNRQCYCGGGWCELPGSGNRSAAAATAAMATALGTPGAASGSVPTPTMAAASVPAATADTSNATNASGNAATTSVP